MSIRQMAGIADLTGKAFGTLRIIRMISRYPAPLWFVRCERCKSQWAEAHATFQRGAVLCRNGQCAKEQELDARRKAGIV